jgi:hypothetical protein
VVKLGRGGLYLVSLHVGKRLTIFREPAQNLLRQAKAIGDFMAEVRELELDSTKRVVLLAEARSVWDAETGDPKGV